MAECVLSGQTALLSIPDVSNVRKKLEGGAGSTDDELVLPAELKIGTLESNKKKVKGNASLGNGIDVIKVASVSHNVMPIFFKDYFFDGNS